MCTARFSSRLFGRGVSVTRPLPVDRQMPVKILPCPKLRLRAVKISERTKLDIILVKGARLPVGQ